MSPVSAFVFYKNTLLLREHSGSAYNQHTRKEAERDAWRRKEVHKRRDWKEIRPENVTNTFLRTSFDMTECRFEAVWLQYVFMLQPFVFVFGPYQVLLNYLSSWQSSNPDFKLFAWDFDTFSFIYHEQWCTFKGRRRSDVSAGCVDVGAFWKWCFDKNQTYIRQSGVEHTSCGTDED